jgi:2-polyprenyl-6-methoxyphenol hydroxylase-like FAD-dependent oxidoreductase
LLVAVDEDAFWGVQAGPRCVIRADLHAALRELVAPQAIHLGVQVGGVQAREDGVGVELADGTVVDGGVLVAADGVRSAIRGKVMNGVRPQAALLSRASWRFITRNPGVDCWVAWTGGHGTALLIPVADDRVYGWVSVRDEQAHGFAQVAAEFAGFPSVVGAALAAAQAEPVPPHHSPLEEVRPPAWTTGRVVFTGDAAHATAPVWAQGAASAVEDGLVIADILAVPDHWPDFGAQFARRRRQRVEHIQSMTDRLSRAATLPPWVRDLLLPYVGPRTYRATYGPLREPGFR